MPPPPDYSQPPAGYPPAGPGHGFYPLDLGRIWSLTFSLYRFKFRTFAGIALTLLVPVGVVTSLISVLSINAVSAWSAEMSRKLASGDLDAASLLGSYPIGSLALSWAAGILVALVSYVVVAAITVAMMNTFVGAPVTVRDSLRAAVRLLGRLALLYLASVGIILGFVFVAAFVFGLALAFGGGQAGIAVFIGLVVFVGLVVLFVHVLMRLQLALPALVVEGIGAGQALRRSWTLARGSLWRIFAYLLIFGIVAAVPAAIVSGVLGAVLRPTTQAGLGLGAVTLSINPIGVFAQSLIAAIVAALFVPITTVAVTLLYLDIRARHGEHVPAPGTPAPAPTQSAPG